MKTLSTTLRFWDRTHQLGRMGLRDLFLAYFTHYAVIVYLVLAAASIRAVRTARVNRLATSMASGSFHREK